MARGAFRSLTPNGSQPNDPLASGIGSFGNSLNNALIRKQKFEQQQQSQQGKQASALDLLLQKFSGQKQIAEDPNKLAPKPFYKPGTGKGGTDKSGTIPVTNLDDLFTKDQKTYQAKLQHAHSNWDNLKKNAYLDPEIGPKLSQTQDPNERGSILKDYFKQNNADDAAILAHASTHLVGGNKGGPVAGQGGGAVTLQGNFGMPPQGQ